MMMKRAAAENAQASQSQSSATSGTPAGPSSMTECSNEVSYGKFRDSRENNEVRSGQAARTQYLIRPSNEALTSVQRQASSSGLSKCATVKQQKGMLLVKGAKKGASK